MKSDNWDAWDDTPKHSSYHKNHSGGSYGGGSYERCYHKHPALKLPGTDLVIYGGSCSSPVVKDADVYIGFDHSMKFTGRHWPWKKGAEFLFEIQDMGTPKHPDEFEKLVKWTKKQLDMGLKVHCGCIGGHGRTGMMLSALVSLYGEKNAIKYVRENYCHKAVESSSQVNFLKQHFGIKSVEGSKSYGGKKSSTKALEGEVLDPGKLPMQNFNNIPCKANIWGGECN